MINCTIDVNYCEPKATININATATVEEDDNSDILTSREVQRRVLDILDAK